MNDVIKKAASPNKNKLLYLIGFIAMKLGHPRLK